MTMLTSALWRRVVVEKRALLVPLLVAAAVNLGVYALVVYPLGVKSANAATRARIAAESLRFAEQDYANARALVTGKSRAEQELTTFYGEVLPSNMMAAVQLTYVPLPTIARKASVHLIARRWQPEAPGRNARLGRLQIVASLQGEYEAFRRFIYELETAPEFVIIDDVTLLQADAGKPLTFTLELSTYYPLVPDAHGN